MKLFLKGRDGQYSAEGFLADGKVTVKKGSMLSAKCASNIPSVALACRESADIDGNMILQEDITFDSASTAGAFVTGNSTNGLRAWKDELGVALGTTYCGKAKKPKKEVSNGRY